MRYTSWPLCAALALLPFAAMAQSRPVQADPADARSPVPAPHYESAFKQYRPATDDPASPDKTWRAANDEMGKLGGHAGHIKDVARSPGSPEQATATQHGAHHH